MSNPIINFIRDNADDREMLLRDYPPPPIYRSPINKVAYIKAFVSDAVLYGTTLIATYHIGSSYIGKRLGIDFPLISKRLWTVLEFLSPLFLYRLAQVLVGIIIHPATVLSYLVSEHLGRCKGLQTQSDDLKGYFLTRFSVSSATGHRIDAVFAKREAGNDEYARCLLVSHGNGMFMSK
ncbi:MAG: hypothetical protein AAGE99_06010 [Chlamydiota bacterium]